MFFGSLLVYFGSFLPPYVVSRTTRNNAIVFFMAAGMVALFYSLRLGIGDDYFQYKSIYDEIGRGGSGQVHEIGFRLYCAVLNFLFGEAGFYILLFSFQFASIILIARYFSYQGVPFDYVLVIFFLSGFVFFSNNAIRQSLSIAILLYSAKFLPSRIFMFLLVNLMATVFVHLSSIVIAIVFFIFTLGHYFRKAFFAVWFVALAAFQYNLVALVFFDTARQL